LLDIVLAQAAHTNTDENLGGTLIMLGKALVV
jgi:hypothetical protein